jgi:hypothetical protein
MIKLKTILKELYSIPGTSAMPTYNVDGEILQVISTYNSIVKQVLRGGVSELNPMDWDFDRHGELMSKSGGSEGYSTQRAVYEDGKSAKAVDNALFRIGWRVAIENEKLVFIPLK